MWSRKDGRGEHYQLHINFIKKKATEATCIYLINELITSETHSARTIQVHYDHYYVLVDNKFNISMYISQMACYIINNIMRKSHMFLECVQPMLPPQQFEYATQ